MNQKPRGSSDDVKDLTDKLKATNMNDGTFITEHRWEKMKPKDVKDKTFKHLVSESKEHKLSAKWIKNEMLDLKAVYDALPDFVGEMTDRRAKSQPTQPTELQQEHSDKPSYHQEPFKASTLSENSNYVFLDCEYLLRMYLPDSFSSWFKYVEGCHNWKRVSSIAEDHESKRWVFTPSYRREKIALMNWPEKDDEELSREKTLRILVVRPSEFDEYVVRYVHLFPVISLPDEGIGVGYARFWIQKIALHLGLKFIWMIDDSIECFYEYDPDHVPKKGTSNEGFYINHRRRKFGLVFKHIEILVKETQEHENPIAAMSPTRFRGPQNKLDDPAFICKPPQGAVFLNLEKLSSKNVFYRPELQCVEDMLFAYECERNGLKVFVDQRIQLQDHKWINSGARQSSPTTQTTKKAQKT